MADSSPPTDKIEQLANSIPEVAITGKEPPERYGYYPRDYVVGNLDAGSLPIMEIAAIDVGLLASPSPTRQQLNELRSALSSFGCFMAINHGMTSSFLDEVHSIVKQFFALPTVEKRKYASEANSREGYGIKEYSPENREFARNNYLALSLSPENQRQLRFWPEYPVNFRRVNLLLGSRIDGLIEISVTVFVAKSIIFSMFKHEKLLWQSEVSEYLNINFKPLFATRSRNKFPGKTISLSKIYP